MIFTTQDGRTIRSGEDYTAFRREVFDLQNGLCIRCESSVLFDLDPALPNSFHLHHKHGRGLGGGKRDDKVKTTEGLCGDCHRADHGQSYSKAKLHWVRKDQHAVAMPT
jgi:hypothetical protein